MLLLWGKDTQHLYSGFPEFCANYSILSLWMILINFNYVVIYQLIIFENISYNSFLCI